MSEEPTEHEVTFDYRTLPTDIVADLQRAAARIRKLRGRQTRLVVELGYELLAVKERLDHGQFGPWIITECALSLRSAQRYMSVATMLGPPEPGKSATVAFFTSPTVLYRLAEGFGPEGFRNDVLGRLRAGETITDFNFEKIYEDHYKLTLEEIQKAKQQADDQAATIRAEEIRLSREEFRKREEKKRQREKSEREKRENERIREAKKHHKRQRLIERGTILLRDALGVNVDKLVAIFKELDNGTPSTITGGIMLQTALARARSNSTGAGVTLDREKLSKLLGMIGSVHDGETINAARAADDLVRRSGFTWEQVV